MAPIGIIIVTYNSAAEIGPCLDAAAPTGADIVVIDNASQDATREEVRRRNIRLIANAENRGFASAVNQGFAALSNPYILLLNPDAVLLSSLEPLRAACDLPGSAGAGGCLVDAGGRPQIGFMARRLPTPAVLVLESLLLNRLWPNNPVNRRYRLLGRDYSTQFPVEQPAGAFLMVRRGVWEQVGGFDEGFHPLWFEDVDFCSRIKQGGWILYFVPQGTARHIGGHSIPRLAVEMRRFYWYRSLLRYSFKHFGRSAHGVVCAAVMIGSILRGIGESVLEGSLKPFASYGRVIRLAGRCLVSGVRP
ncbi:MAG: glycosyltransferase family 2 protein [Acidobacteria bacterium]|nr:glycosyltransferase family 2 protein [Acidobacteriota bacterium]